MLINKQTQAIVQQLKDISEGIVFQYPVTYIHDAARSINAYIDMEALNNEPFETFGIIKIKEFFDLLKIIDSKDTDISLNRDTIEIRSSKINANYITTNLRVFDGYNFDIRPCNNGRNGEACAEFLLENKELDMIKKTSSLLSLENLILNIKEGKVEVSVSGDTSDNNNMSIAITQIKNTQGNHSLAVSMANIRKLPAANYIVRVVENKHNPGIYVVALIPENISPLTILISTLAV